MYRSCRIPISEIRSGFSIRVIRPKTRPTPIASRPNAEDQDAQQDAPGRADRSSVRIEVRI